jgi:hypothetical protein
MLLGTVRTWYKYDVSFSASMIESFVAGIEKQAADSIRRYEQEKETHEIEDVMETGEPFVRVVRTHEGLDDEAWDMDTIFKEHFPSLQRRSAFVTVSSYFEHELNELCSLYQREKGFQLSFKDLNDKGIVRSTNYLEKVAGLDVHKKSQEWCLIKKLHEVRNSIVHRDGRLEADQDKVIRCFVAEINQLAALSSHDEILLKEGFLSLATDTYKSYFRLIDKSIQVSPNICS